MAFRRARTNNTKSSKFCKFCKHAGKSHSEYTSHYPKDQPGPKGKVICPTILSTECSYCHVIGHAKNHCPKLRKCKNRDARDNNGRFAPKKRPQFQMNNGWNVVQKQQKHKRSTAPKKAMAFQNKYAMLMEADVVETTTFPLPKPSNKPQRLMGSWSNTLSKSVKEEAEFKPNLSSIESHSDSSSEEETTEVAQLSAQEVLKKLFDENQQTDQNKMWGDMISDEEYESDDDDEEETIYDSMGRPSTDNSAW